MHEILDALAAQHAELAGLLDDLADDGWLTPVGRCPGWDVTDVVLHLAQTHEMAAASVAGRFHEYVAAATAGLPPATDVDDGASAMVARERIGASPAAVHDRWRQAAASVRDALGAGDPHARVEWVAGTLSVHTLTATRLSETWIHTGDIADALGTTLPGTARLRHIARLAWRTLPYAFERAGRSLGGPVAFDLDGPDGERWTFEPDEPAATTITGPGVDLCLVAARRLDPEVTNLRGVGPDAAAVLELVRTYA